MRIILSGGGSGGPVSPILAVATEIKKLKPKTEFLFVGTKKGPERTMVEEMGLPFVYIPAARWRRFLTLKNLFAPFKFAAGLLKARSVVKKFEPDVVFSAGGFVAVPVCWAAKSFGAKIIIHQQDARVGLANKLIAPVADQITTAFEQNAKDFYSGSGLDPKKMKAPAEWVGNPVRPELLIKNDSAKGFFKLHDKLPILLVLGGATGALQINRMVAEIIPDLVSAHQVVHQTGKGKKATDFEHPNYHPVELIPFREYASIMQMAHLVVSRAGLSSIAELSALNKTAIIIPMPGTHQEDNAQILAAQHAAVVLLGMEATAENLARVINSLKFNPKRDEMLSENIGRIMPRDAGEKIAKIIIKHAGK